MVLYELGQGLASMDEGDEDGGKRERIVEAEEAEGGDGFKLREGERGRGRYEGQI